MVCREPDVEVPRQAVLADNDTCMLDRFVRKEELCTHNRGLRIARGIGGKRVEPARFRNRVVVQKYEVVTTGRCRAVVAGGGEASVRLTRDDPDGVGVLMEQLGGGI